MLRVPESAERVLVLRDRHVVRHGVVVAAPGHHGPNGEWERCTNDTGLPLIVCNRTGPDRTLDFRQAESVVVKDGRRLLSLSSTRSAVFTIQWDVKKQTLASQDYQTLYL